MRTIAAAQHKKARAVVLLLEGRSYDDIAVRGGTHIAGQLTALSGRPLSVEKSQPSTSCGNKTLGSQTHYRRCCGPWLKPVMSALLLQSFESLSNVFDYWASITTPTAVPALIP